MKMTGKQKSISSNDPKSPRKFYQFVLETVWASAVSMTVGHWVP